MHFSFHFDPCPVHSPFGLMHLMHQNLSTHALFCLNSLTKVRTELLIWKYSFVLIIFLSQLEVHVFNYPKKLIDHCEDLGIKITVSLVLVWQ